MKKAIIFPAILTAISTLYTINTASAHEQAETTKPVTAYSELFNMMGDVIGEAHLTQGSNGVLIHLKLSNLTAGKHGLHLHSHAACDPETGFRSAMGHVGKQADAHGLLNPKGPEPGDLPNLYVHEDGSAELEIYTTLVTLKEGDNALLDEDGSTFVIHEKADDHISQPIGGAGGRVACGIIVPSDSNAH